MKHWWCAGCEAEVGLDKHGRCGNCGSEAVDLVPAENELNRPVSANPKDTDLVQTRA
jgi:hypothetical protein